MGIRGVEGGRLVRFAHLLPGFQEGWTGCGYLLGQCLTGSYREKKFLKNYYSWLVVEVDGCCNGYSGLGGFIGCLVDMVVDRKYIVFFFRVVIGFFL